MVTKGELLKQFQKEPEKHWKVEIFEKEGFQRKVCPGCGKGYWTLQADRTHCPDPGCGEEYGFLGNTITKVKTDYIETWKLFEKFFVKNGHASVPRYPVISRWREDLYFNIASIVDFQRFDEGVMTFDYPDNPLIVPQVCMRFNDIPNVGVSGRHHSCFVMPGQHAFNMPKEGYDHSRTLDLNFRFLTEEMGIPKEELIYTEDLWTMPDFSALGPYIETFSRGLELCNSGHMKWGMFNGNLKELPMQAIDVGWGLERLCWFANGTPTGYEAVFGPVVDKLKDACGIEYDEEFFLKYAKIAGTLNVDEASDLTKARNDIAKKLGTTGEILEKKIAPLEGMYAVADHTRALAFAISDGGLPSNIGGGYNLRVILRRALSFIEKFGWNIKLEDVAIWHGQYLKKLFPEIADNEEDIKNILQVEEKRYEENRTRAAKIIQSFAGKEISADDLVKLYDSQGITPEQLGIPTPSDFYTKVTEKHMGEKAEVQKSQLDVSQIPATKILYYEEPYIFEFEAKVIAVLNENFIVLDQTAFYPTSGGQQHDMGTIDNVAVTDVFKIGKVIVHRTFGKVESGKTVRCVVDKDRRKILMRHHDAVHVVNGATKKILGNHVNQAGAEKDIDKARLDITHYEALTEDEVKKVEDLANQVVDKAIDVKKHVLSRSEAERRFGFRIYQGGYVPSKEVRIVEIPNFDIEACGGTHGDNTGEIGRIVITKTKRIADGVVRVELKAGDVAENYLREKEKILNEVAQKLSVKGEDVPSAVEKIFAEWKNLRKRK